MYILFRVISELNMFSGLGERLDNETMTNGQMNEWTGEWTDNN